MTDLLTTLAQRTLGGVPVAQPVIAPRFAHPPAMPELDMPGDTPGVSQNDAPGVSLEKHPPVMEEHAHPPATEEQPHVPGRETVQRRNAPLASAHDVAPPQRE